MHYCFLAEWFFEAAAIRDDGRTSNERSKAVARIACMTDPVEESKRVVFNGPTRNVEQQVPVLKAALALHEERETTAIACPRLTIGDNSICARYSDNVP
jgi:hypothetical protein